MYDVRNRPERKEMKGDDSALHHRTLEELYGETAHWQVNLGEETVHAKRIPGRFRNLKWGFASLYLVFFLGPYLRWNGRQAVLFDIPSRHFHIFGYTIWPQDIWMLALLLITFFISLYLATAMAGRAWCGYLCWQTVWTDVFTWIEEKLEGPPRKRMQLDKAPWGTNKIMVKGTKHLIFLLISALTGITFTAYFIDVYDLWGRYFRLEGPVYIWATPVPFLIGTYLSVGFMREQVCFWLCPYARIQSAMTDMDTTLPAYDPERGEPRGRVKRDGSSEKDGDCVDCNLCVAVCPTGIDIRNGQQEGCITCALCIDACDSIMEKVGRPKGLIRYMSLKEMLGERLAPFYKRPRVIIYSALILICLSIVLYGLTHMSPMKINVVKDRQPLFVRLSDGAIQNRYTIKVINRTDSTMDVGIYVSGPEGASVELLPHDIRVAPRSLLPVVAIVKVPAEKLSGGNETLSFTAENAGNREMRITYKSSFTGPRR